MAGPLDPDDNEYNGARSGSDSDPSLPRHDSIETIESSIGGQINLGAVEKAKNDQRNAVQPNSDQQQSGKLETTVMSVPQAFGRYEVRGMLGEGGFGTVYLGYDTQLDRQVAIKAPRLDVKSAVTQQQFLAEARQLAKLNHTGIVSVFDVGIEGRQCYIVSSYLDGESLAAKLKNQRYTWQESAQITAAIANALAHAHSQRVVHRDLKPANIIMTDRLTPVIVDFGLGLSDAQMTGEQRGVIAGTPSYMSPEQTRGEGHRIDGRTDIYALGVILYRMLTGRLPFQAKTSRELLRQIQEDEPQPPRQLVADIPKELERVCLKALDKHLRHRFTTAGDLAEELLALLADDARSAPSAPRINPAKLVEADPVNELTYRPPTISEFSSPLPPVEPTKEGAVAERVQEVDSSSPSSTHRSREALRRRITLVMFGCDVFTGSEAVESLDMEEQQELLREFQKVCRDVAKDCGGTTYQETVDGTLVCFGYPTAMEDASLRAVRCGRQLLDRMEEFNRKRQRTRSVRIRSYAVVHCDQAIVQDKGPQAGGLSIVGQVLNVITQLDRVAKLDAVSVTSDVKRLLPTRFEWESLGPQQLRGDTTKELFRMVCERTSEQATSEETEGMTPLVGRDLEVGLLRERWEQATEGMGQVVLLIGEAGLGKSRLVQTLRQHVHPDIGESAGDDSSRVLKKGEPTIIELRSSPQFQSSSLYPVIEYFHRRCRIDRMDPPEVKLDKLVNQLAPLNLDSDKQVALLAALLSIPLGNRYPALDLDPQRQKELTFELLIEWLRELVYEHPVLLIVEDLHWVDPTTLEFLEGFVSHGLNDSILTLLTFRPEFVTPWKSMAHQTQIALNRLTRRQIGEMVQRRAGDRSIPQSVIDQIVERTDGVPLFVEEFARMAIESRDNTEEQAPSEFSNSWSSASGSSGSMASERSREIPATLQDLLMTRLDRIDANIEVAQLGATIGREFSQELIFAVSPFQPSELQLQLDKLVAAEVLVARGRAPRTQYQFKHALIQDAAYGSLVKQRRQMFHRRIAETLESKFSELATTQPEIIAQHFTEADVIEKAIDYWDKAGARSLQKRAHKEAIQHYHRGIELLQLLPESPERWRRELNMFTALGIPLQATIGYSAPEVEYAYSRAHELCDKLGQTTEQFPVLYGMFRYYLLQAKYPKARELGKQLLNIAEQTHTPHYIVAANRARGGPPVYDGHPAEAVPYLEALISIEPTSELRSELNRYDVVDPWIASRSYLSWATWLLGKPEQSLAHSDAAVRIALSLDHTFSAALAISFSQWVHQFRRDVEKTRTTAENALAIALQNGFAFWYGWCGVMHGWAIAQQGRAEEAIVEIRKGIVDWRAQGSELGSHYYYILLAEACAKGGKYDDAVLALKDATQFAAETGEAFFVSEIPRLRGKLMLTRDANAVQDAESCYREALELARSQEAKSLELRAANSWARLLQKQGHAVAARDLLEPIYKEFTEGFDTSDLIAAKKLLESLT
ncbi:MAG: protein kinase [Planctomycetaceae bacterium]